MKTVPLICVPCDEVRRLVMFTWFFHHQRALSPELLPVLALNAKFLQFKRVPLYADVS